jgi:hypothetical protein
MKSIGSLPCSQKPVSDPYAGLESILILSSHSRLGLPSGLVRSGFQTKMLYPFLRFPCVLHVPSNSSSLICLP